MICPVPLVNGGSASVDELDWPLVCQYKWRRSERDHISYATRWWWSAGSTHIQYLHHLIMPLTGGIEVDHIDHNGLNCTRTNMRYATRGQNAANRSKHNNLRVGYKGVWPVMRGGNFAAMIRSQNVRSHLGTFPTPVAAALAYDIAADRLFGEFAHLNFPERPMRCESCQGSGWQMRPHPPKQGYPCKECNGSGLAHCCEGDSACNDADNDATME